MGCETEVRTSVWQEQPALVRISNLQRACPVQSQAGAGHTGTQHARVLCTYIGIGAANLPCPRYQDMCGRALICAQQQMSGPLSLGGALRRLNKARRQKPYCAMEHTWVS